MSIKKKFRKIVKSSFPKRSNLTRKKTISSSKITDTVSSKLPLSSSLSPAPIISVPAPPPPVDLSINSPTGIAPFDELLGGGFPKGSVVLVAGSSGSGKTIFCFQWLFQGIKNNENGLYISLTEPLFKSVKNLETLSFYDRTALEQERLKIADLRAALHLDGRIEKENLSAKRILDYIEQEVKKINAKRLCIDSVTAIAYMLEDKAKIRAFIFELGKMLAALGCTSFLTSEVTEEGKYSVYSVEEFIADAIIRLDQRRQRDSIQRVIQIGKVRGRAYHAEDIDFRITKDGIIVFPHLALYLTHPAFTERISIGNAALDTMLMGGIFRASSTLLVGSTGTGKSLTGLQFVAEGLRKGEPCLYAGFEEGRDQILRNALSIGLDFAKYEEKGLLTMRCIYPGEKFLEEHLQEIRNIVESKGIKHCVVDSLSSISASFSEDQFRMFVRTLNGYLKSKSVTSLFLTAASTFIGGTTLTDAHLSTITDNIIVLRYVEVGGNLKHVVNVVKFRGSGHSKGLREYEITSKGIVIGQGLTGYEGIMTGSTKKVSESTEEKLEYEFKKCIGPMAASAFAELKENGLNKENIVSYIDELLGQKILKPEQAENFKRSVSTILSGGTVQQEMEEEKQNGTKSFAGLFHFSKKKE